MAEWRENMRILFCADGQRIKPCPRCHHAFGEHNMVGDCLTCMRADTDCMVDMHETWPHLLPALT